MKMTVRPSSRHVAAVAVGAGAVTEAEAAAWLRRLDWEGDANFFGPSARGLDFRCIRSYQK